MSLNGFTLNGAALNGAALLVFSYATASGSAEAVGTSLAYKTQYVSVLADASVVVTLTPEHTQLAKSNASSESISNAEGLCTYAGACIASSTAVGSIYALNTITADFSATANAEGYAIPASTIAGFGDFPLVTGSAEGTITGIRIQYARSLAAAEATGTAGLGRTRNGDVNAVSGCTGYADWQYQASGLTTWVFDGHAWPTATAIGSVDETKYKIEVGDGFIATAEASANIVSYRTQVARSTATATTVATVAGGVIAIGQATASSTAEAAVTGVRIHMANVLAASGAMYSQTPKRVIQTFAGNAIGVATNLSTVVGTIYKHAACIATVDVLGTTIGEIWKMARVTADASVIVNMALAYSNYTVRAPDSRSMVVPTYDNQMAVPYEDRLMRIAA